MIKVAQAYEAELNKKYIDTWYDDRYIFYRSFGTGGIKLPDNNYDCRDFVSVDDNNNVIGYIHYQINWAAKSCNNFGLISFNIGNVRFLKDAIQVVDDIFLKYNFNRIDWMCFEDNPAIKGYRNFIKRFGGRECGYFTEIDMLSDGKLHNVVNFEILKKDYKRCKYEMQ